MRRLLRTFAFILALPVALLSVTGVLCLGVGIVSGLVIGGNAPATPSAERPVAWQNKGPPRYVTPAQAVLVKTLPEFGLFCLLPGAMGAMVLHRTGLLAQLNSRPHAVARRLVVRRPPKSGCT